MTLFIFVCSKGDVLGFNLVNFTFLGLKHRKKTMSNRETEVKEEKFFTHFITWRVSILLH